MPATSRIGRFIALNLTVLTTVLSLLMLAPAPAAQAARAPMTTASRVYAVRNARVWHALKIARHHIGSPYVYGGTGPGSFDCSGLTYFAYHLRSGFRGLPRTAAQQAGFGHRIRRSQMRKGDLMFFFGSSGVYHVGIFDGWRHGARLVLHAPYPGARVRVERVWTNAWFPRTLR